MLDNESKQRIRTELIHAEQARSSGNQGRSRVCARRAAGIAVREYLSQRKIGFTDPSAISVLSVLTSLEDVPEMIIQCADHLLTRVDTNYQLPQEIDLIDQTNQLIDALEKHLRGVNLV